MTYNDQDNKNDYKGSCIRRFPHCTGFEGRRRENKVGNSKQNPKGSTSCTLGYVTRVDVNNNRIQFRYWLDCAVPQYGTVIVLLAGMY